MDIDRIESAETKLAYMEKAVSEMSALVYEYGQRVERLEKGMKAVMSRLVELDEEKTQKPSSERPPHY